MSSPPRRLLRAKAVASKVPYSIRSIKRKAADPSDPFPAGLRISDRVTAWVEDEVDAWIAAEIDRCRRPGAAPDEGRPAHLALPLDERAAGTGSTGRRRGRPPVARPHEADASP
jgi:predicted DNA-binding transcriptional regulator AlpA